MRLKVEVREIIVKVEDAVPEGGVSRQLVEMGSPSSSTTYEAKLKVIVFPALIVKSGYGEE